MSGFARDAGGQLSIINCRGESAPSFGLGAGCRAGDGLSGAEAVAVAPDGLTVYVSAPASGNGGFSAFVRQRAPSCSDSAITATSGQPITISLPCSDPNQDALTRAVVTPPANGSLGALDQATASIAYTSSDGFTGNDSFTFRATDGSSNNSSPAAVSITVVAPGSPDAPLPDPGDPSDPGDPGTGDPGTGPPVVNGGPDSDIASIKKKVRRRKLKRFKGIATDDSGLQRVDVSLVRLTGKRCFTLKAGGGFSRRVRNGSCKPTRFLPAAGTAKWTFKLKRRLPRGRYVLYSRAVDTSALGETRFSRKDRNRVAFRVI